AGTAGDIENTLGKERLKLAGVQIPEDSAPGYIIALTHCYFDLDEDGIDADLEVVWNMNSGGVLKASYNRWDTRPFVLECYQDRAHMPYGIGVIEADMSYEMLLTELFNNRVWNLSLSNMKIYTGPESAMNEVTGIYPGKFIPNDGTGKIEALDM